MMLRGRTSKSSSSGSYPESFPKKNEYKHLKNNTSISISNRITRLYFRDFQGNLDELLETIPVDKRHQITFISMLNNGLSVFPTLDFKNLETIICCDNNITELPKSLPSLLKKLNCSDNKIKVLPVNLPSSLVELNCSNNEITVLPENLPSSLKNLNCSNNKIKVLPKILPDYLEELKCNYNEIIELPENIPITLNSLNCSYNKITKIDLTKLEYSKNHKLILNISFNTKLEELSIKEHTLKDIYLDSYQFTKFIEELHNKRINLKIHVSMINNVIPHKNFNFSAGSVSYYKPSEKELTNWLTVNYKNNIIRDYKLPRRIDGGSKTVKNSKNSKKNKTFTFVIIFFI